MPLSQIVSASIEDGAVAPVDLSSVAQYTGFKNRLINGAMAISQRGTSFSTPTNGAYTLDRWQVIWAGAAPASVAQVAGIGGYQYALQMTGSASNTQIYVSQKIESANVYDLAGTTVTMSAVMQSSTTQTLLWYAYYPNAKDNYATATAIAFGTFNVTTSAQTFSAQINLPSGVQNGLWILFYPQNGGAFTSGTITITGVQLEKGVTATSFDYRPYGAELVLCQRYYEADSIANGGNGVSFIVNTANYFPSITFLVAKRVSPTMTITTTAGSGAALTPGVYGFYQSTANSAAAGSYWTASAEL